ncbi:PKD domain-containing protein [Tamlana sp. I1]|uniref:PKD domain-containing protein n=1 Tax=Tamlana sp. I1 TaxID=2762061 RepID=UPI00188E41F7|nr:gliding motility-associated C-terminal domain-containing protein [Tamlana sp. I1]
MKNSYLTNTTTNTQNLIRLALLIFVFSLTFTSVDAQSCTLNAGLDQTICDSDVFQLDGTTPDTYTEGPIWTQISGPSVIISDPTIDDPIITGFSGGNTYVFQLSATCPNGLKPKQTVSVTVEAVTIANAGVDLASCPDDSGALIINGNTPSNPGEIGQWSIEGNNGGGVVINQPDSPTSTITLPETSAGTTVLRWTITGPEYAPGQFCESTSEITITNYGGVDPVDAGPDQTLSNCYTVSESTNLDASFGGDGTNGQQGTWTFVSGPSNPNIADVHNNSTNVSGLVEGVYVFRWDVTGPCVSGSDTVTITVPAATQDVTTAVVTNGNQHFCDPNATEATLSGSTPNFTNETVLWEQISGPAGAVIQNPTSSTTLVTGLVAPNSYQFRYTIINNVTNCTTEDEVNIRYNDDPVSITVNSGDDFVGACEDKSIEIPYQSTGGNKTEYSIESGPADSALSFPTPYVNLGSADSGTVSIDDFDVAGAYSVNFRRSTSGNILQGCGVANASITIYISTTPSGSSAGARQLFNCGATSGSLAGSAIQPGETSEWSQVSGPNTAVIADPYAQTTGISGLVPGLYLFRYIVSAGPACQPFASSTTLAVVSPVDNGTADAGSPQTVCVDAPVQLAANTPNIVLTGTWTASDPGIVFSDVNDPNAIATGFSLPSTDYTLTWTIENTYTNCGPPAESTVIISTTNESAPTVANAGADFCLPSGTTTIPNLDGNTTEVDEIGTWTQISGPSTAVFADVNNPTTAVSGLVNGNYEFQWEIAFRPFVTNACSTTTDTVNVVIADTGASVAAGPDQSLCLDPTLLSFTMAADAPQDDGVGTWVLVSGAGGYNVDDIHSPTATFSNLSNGTYIFAWYIDYGGCVTSVTPDQVTIQVGIPPTPAVIQGGDQVLCGTTTTTITADPIQNPNVETGSWTVVSGPNTPTISDTSSNTITVTGMTTGSYVFRWTTVSGSLLCPNSTADVTVDVYAHSESIPNQQLCDVTSVFLEATPGTTGTWTIISVDGATDAGIIAPFAPTQSPNNSNTANAPVDATQATTYVYEYTTDYTGSGAACNNTVQTTVEVSNGPSIAPLAGPDQTLCETDITVANPVQLQSGNTSPLPSDITSEWRLLSQPNGANTVIVSPGALTTDVTGLDVQGVYVFELNFASNFCTDEADVVRVEIFDEPSDADAGPDQDLACQDNTQLDATAPTVGIGTWSFANPSDDPSGGVAVIDSPNNPKTTLSNIPDDAGNDGLDDVYILTWTVSNGSMASPAVCAPKTDTVTLTYTGAPPSPAVAGPDQEYCDVTQATLAATAPTVGIGTWTQTAGNAANITAPNNPNTLVLGLTAGTYEFTWTVNDGGCSSFDTMNIEIYSDPLTANAGPDQLMPEFSIVNLDATPATVGQRMWTQISGPTNATFVDELDPKTQVTGTTVGDYVFQWTVSNGICNAVSDQVIITIQAISDLELTKSVTPSSVNIGDTVTFTLAVYNNNDDAANADATGVSVQDVLPLGYTLVPGTVSNNGSFDLATQTITWTNLSITNGSTINLTFDATVNGSGTYVNVAQITASANFDPDSTPNNDDGDQSEDDEANAQISLQSADLSLDKSVSVTDASVGDTVVFTLTVSNDGPDEATHVAVSDQLPNGYTYQSDDSSGSYNVTSGIWTVGTVAVGTPEVLNITATVNAPSTSSNNYLNSAQVIASDQADPDSTPDNDDGDQSEDDEDNATVTLQLADLEVTKSLLLISGSVGETVTFSVLVENKGPGNATGVDIQDLLPNGFDLVPGTVSNGGVYQLGNNSIVWNDLTIANTTSVTLTYDAVVNDSGNYTNTVQITASDLQDPDSTPNNDDGDQSEDDEDAATFVIEEADLELTKAISTTSSTTPNIGDTVTFELTLLNNGPNDASGITIEDVLPTGYTLTSGTISNGGTLIGNQINWTGLSLVNRANMTLSYDVVVNMPTGNVGEYTNLAQITASNQFDPDSDPNTGPNVDDLNDGIADDDETEFTITPQTADLSINKTVSNNNPNVGDVVTFTIALSNAGSVDATGVSVQDMVPVGYSNITNISNSGVAAGNQIDWTGFAVPVGIETVILTFDATVNAPTGASDEYLNTTQITASDQYDPDSTPNNDDGDQSEDDEDAEGITIKQADLSITKSIDNLHPNSGDTVIYTLVVTNSGPDTATNVAVEDVLPVGLTLTAVNNSGTQTGNTANWSGLTVLANNGSVTLTYEATVNTPTGANGEYTNVAQIIASDQYDPDSDPSTDETVDEDGDGNGFDDDEATLTITITEADLSLTKTVVNNDTAPLEGSQITFEIRVTNDGPDLATGVAVTDLVPSGFDYVSYSSTKGIYNELTGVWSVENVVAGATEVLLLDVIVNDSGDYLNIAQVTASDQIDPDSTPNNDDATEDDQDSVLVTPVAPMADLSLTKAVVGGNTSPLQGDPISFEITVTNAGPQDATGVTVTDLLPTGFTYVSFNTSSGTYNSTTGIWTVGTVINGASETLAITALVNATGDYLNIAQVTASDIGDADSTPNNDVTTEDDQDSVQITPVAPLADLSLTKTVVGGNTSPLQGDPISFEITVTNAGPQDATGVTVTDLLPTGFTYVSFNTSSGTYNSTTGIWTVGTVINGASETLAITALVNATGDYLNIAQVTASDIGDPDSTPNNDDATEDDQDSVQITPVTPMADLSLTKTIANGNTSPIQGSVVTFEITVTNDGPQDATGVEITDLLPSGFNYISFSTSTGSYNHVTGIWTAGTIANGASETLLIDARINGFGDYLNSAQVSASDLADPDSTPNNDDATEDDQDSIQLSPVVALADLSLTKEVVGGNTSPLIGSQITFQITVSNDGPNIATGVEVTDVLPPGFDYVLFSATSGSYNQATGVWTVGLIPNGSSQTLLIDALVNAPTGATDEHLNNAEVTGSTINDPDSTPNNNDPSEDDQDSILITPVNALADLSLSKQVVNGNTSPLVGSQITFEISVANDGPNVATGVAVIDMLPVGFEYVSFSATSGVYNQGTGLWTVGIVPTGGTQTLLIDAIVKVPTGAADEYTNTAQVSASDLIDPDSTPNNDDGDQSEDDEDNVVVTPLAIVADLSLTKTVVNNNLAPNVGDQITFEISVTNSGPNTATGVEVTDVLPAGFNYVLYSSTSGTYNQATGLWRTGTIMSGDTQTLLVDVTVNAPTGTANEFLNSAEVSASDVFDPDSTPNNNDPSEDDQDSILIMTETADLSLDKSVSNVNANVGEVVTFTLQIDNAGPNEGTGVAVEDVLPIGYSNITNISNGGLWANNVINWTNLNVPLSGLTLTFEATVNMPTLQDNEYFNKAQITASDQFDTDSTPNNDDGDQSEDDESSVTINTPITDIEVVKEVDFETPSIGDDITFTITATNLGSINATTVEIVDALPTGYQFVSYTATSGTYDDATGSWLIPEIAGGAKTTLSLLVTVKDVNDYLNTATLQFLDQIDANSDNDTSETSITPSCLTIYNEFSPNGNGKNEFFYIDCINNYPNNALEIYNRWGNLVYSKAGYDNTFNGESNGGSMFKKGEELPAGTYYYILDLGDGSDRKSGWLYLAR